MRFFGILALAWAAWLLGGWFWCAVVMASLAVLADSEPDPDEDDWDDEDFEEDELCVIETLD